VEALQYVPNAAARSLIHGRTETLALVVADITNPFFTTLARGVEDGAQEHGYTLILGNSDETLAKERAYLDVMVARRVDGIILSPTPGPAHNLEVLTRHHIPVVLIDRRIANIDVDVVRGDSTEAGRLLTHHLIDLGHQRIAFVGGPAGVSSLEDRLAGYREALKAAELTPSVHLGRYDRASGEEIVSQMVAGRADLDFTALIAANNAVAGGALTALARAGLRVPDAVSLVCFEEYESDAVVDPFLTVVIQPAYEIGKHATTLLIDRIRGTATAARDVVLPVTLRVRRSAASPLQPGNSA
jgi:LacI family transcriptional regulator